VVKFFTQKLATMGQFFSRLKAIDVRKFKIKLPKRVAQQKFFLDKREDRLSKANLSLVADEYKNVPKHKFQMKEYKFDGNYTAQEVGKKEQRTGKSIEGGIAKFKAHPNLYTAIFYPTEMKDWPENEQQYVFIYRDGTVDFRAKKPSKKGKVTLLTFDYQPLKSLNGDELPKKNCDEYTDTVLSKYKGKKLHSKKNPPILPGRGMGCCDSPGIKLIGDVDPSSIEQGQIGNCWLLSGIASLAEYDGAIDRLFRKTKNFGKLPKEGPNEYTVTLYDLETWKEVDIVVDERLCARADGSRKPLGAKPTADSELWVSYLEKAIAAHCGGWDKIDGGNCTHAWALLTGVKSQYLIQKKEGTDKFVCSARYNTKKMDWVKHGNAPSDGNQGMWEVPWPGTGKENGGGKKELSPKQLFAKVCAWHDENFLIGASSKGDSDKHSTDGIVDNHAYSVVDCRRNVAGSGVDMIQVRNPWGYGESNKGKFRDKGPGWKKHPEIKKALNPVFGSVDDGLFWLTRQELFKYYDCIYVGAANMKDFLKKKK